jgi:hypothetical protein
MRRGLLKRTGAGVSMGGATGGASLLAIALLALSCGDGSPTTPTSRLHRSSGLPARTVVTVVSGETGEPLAGARVVVAGTSYATDEAGQLALREWVRDGAEVDVEAPNCLPRQTRVRAGDTRLTLWPDHAELPAEYTKKLVYTASTVHDAASLVPLDRLPPRVHALSLAPSAALEADPRALAAHHQAADHFNAAVGGGTVFSVGQGADMTVPTRIDTDDPSCEGRHGRLLARTWVSEHEVTRAEIVFCSEVPTRAPAAIAHELGHIFGLAHSPDPREIMHPFHGASDAGGFSPREALVMRLLHLRRGGNTWPDNDRTVTAEANGVREFVD